MNSERVKMLVNSLKEDPNDPFTKYALALEYLDQNDQYASQLFTELLNDNPEYIPTYYQAAHLFVKLGEDEQAETVFKKGISLTLGKDPKTYHELQNAYQNFLFERDE